MANGVFYPAGKFQRFALIDQVALENERVKLIDSGLDVLERLRQGDTILSVKVYVRD